MKATLAFLSRRGHVAGFLRGLASGVTAQAAGFLLNLWTVRVSVLVLGSMYGSWLAGFAALSVIGLVECGLGPFLIRETARLRAEGASRCEWSSTLSTVLSAYLVVTGVSLLMGWLAAPWLADLITPEPGAPADLVFALRWGAVQIAIAQPLGMWRSLVHGSQKLVTLGYLSIIESLTLAICTTALLMLWPALWALPLALLLSAGVSALVAYTCTPSEIRRAIWPIMPPKRQIIDSLVAYCRPWIGAKVCFLIRERTDEPIASRFVGAEAVVAFTVTQRLVRAIPLTLLGSATSLGFAPLSEVLPSGDTDRVRQAVLTGFRWLVLFAVGCAALIWAVNPIFVELWIGPFLYGGDLLSLVFCTWIVIEACSRGLGIVLYAAGKHATMMRAQLAEAGLNVTLSLLLVRPLGLVGIALGTALASLASTSWAVPRAVFQLLSIGRADVMAALPSKFLFKTTLLVVGIVLSRSVVAGADWIFRLVVPCATGSILTLTLFWHDWRVWVGDFQGR